MRRTTLLACAVVLALAACSADAGDDGIQPTAAPVTTSGAPGEPGDGAAATTTPSDGTAASGTTTAAPVPTTGGAPTTGATTLPPTTTSSATTSTAAPLVPLDELQLTLSVVADGFEQPVFLTSPPGDTRLFVVDQPGRIWVMTAETGDDPEEFLDIRDQIAFGGERGLLGLAFPPDHADSGLFYVNYTNTAGATTVSEFTAGDPDSERVLLEVPQPAENHNGGMLAFGPDGQLWIGMGDGGASDDRFDNAQNPTTLLGSMVRIDPAGDPYAIPADNPGLPFAPEVWGIGLRNPWRFSFDDGTLWIGDVGQNSVEEIDRIDVATGAGANFGWPLYEGTDCYLASECDDTGFVRPVHEYRHGEGCSVTGGYVYRGRAIPELDGHYFFGDFCSGWIRAITPDDTVTEWFPGGTVDGLTSFGMDHEGELYVTSRNGAVYRLVRVDSG